MAWTVPSHFLNQCWNIVNWTLGNKLQWNFNRNSSIFIQEKAVENVVCKMVSILSWLQCVNINIMQSLVFPGSLNKLLNKQYCQLYETPWYSCDVTVLCYIGLCYNGTQLYKEHSKIDVIWMPFINIVFYYMNTQHLLIWNTLKKAVRNQPIKADWCINASLI